MPWARMLEKTLSATDWRRVLSILSTREGGPKEIRLIYEDNVNNSEAVQDIRICERTG
jgi:hypothetical protein